jgi:hypothetical protein
MSGDAIEILARAGAPVGPPRAAPSSLPDDAELRRAAFWVASHVAPDDLVPHVAWLSAFRHHWPTRFSSVFGRRGEELLAELRRAVADENRYLKLRRIAVENLAAVL